MRRNSWKYFVALVALSVMLVPAFAKPVTKTVDLVSPQKIAGKELREGSYLFKVDDTKLTILLKNKVVAEAEGRWEPRDSKVEHDTFVSGPGGQIQEIRFAGEKRVFVIAGN